MNRIRDCFEDLRRTGRKALVAYLTAGDPTPAASERRMRTALRNGVDVLEVGVPFSDPTADGPVIQAAGARALKAGTDMRVVLGLIRNLRRDYGRVPIILFSYANPLLAYGYERLCRDAAAAGVDGMLVVDLPPEEAGELRRWMRPHGLRFIPLVAPTTPLERLRAILAQADDGFVYYILVKGVTGGKSELPPEVLRHLRMVRRHARMPVAAGFGVRDARQARRAARHADGVVVGSALIEAARAGRLAALTSELSAALNV